MTKGTVRGSDLPPLGQPVLWRLCFTRVGVSKLAWVGCRAKGSAGAFPSYCSQGLERLSPWERANFLVSAVGGSAHSFFPGSGFSAKLSLRSREDAGVPHHRGAGVAQSPPAEHGSIMALRFPHSPFRSFWDYSNKLFPSVSLGQVKEELMSSIRGAAESPGLPELPSSPSAANGTCPCSGGGRRAVGTQRCLPRSAPRVPLWSLLPRCVLACFYNKDNSSASCHFSSLSLAGGTKKPPCRLCTTCPLGNKQAQRPLGCTSCCKYPVKMLDPRRNSVVQGFVRRDQGSGSL